MSIRDDPEAGLGHIEASHGVKEQNEIVGYALKILDDQTGAKFLPVLLKTWVSSERWRHAKPLVENSNSYLDKL